MNTKEIKLAVIGLGYVGLPLAIEFGKKRNVIGYDISEKRIADLNSSFDETKQMNSDDFDAAKYLKFSSNQNNLKECNCYIVTVPTPIDKNKKPNLSPLIGASKMLGSQLSKGDIVIFESTVFPGATEEECIPVIENASGLEFNNDFFCGYSPERINPGDKEHTLSNIVKVTSGSTPEISDLIDDLYNEIICAGTFKASSIKVAEAAKVIENTQRDLNIALINELAIIFNEMEIDTEEVLLAAGSKWNFIPFRPGMVGGHCIGVDPYYLTHKAQALGYQPEIILAGRRLNENMHEYLISKLLKYMAIKRIQVAGSKILIMGLTFKENCTDIRNTRIIDLFNNLNDFGCDVDIFDPWVIAKEAKDEYSIAVKNSLESENYYDVIILAVGHDLFLDMGTKEIKKFGKKNHILFDLKYLFPKEEVDIRF